MIELKTEEQKREYELELARIKAWTEVQLNDYHVRKAFKFSSRIQFIYTFLITVVGACIVFYFGSLSGK